MERETVLFIILTATTLLTNGNFIRPTPQKTDIAARSTRISGETCDSVDCYRQYCAGRSSTPDYIRLLGSVKNSSCRTGLSSPPSESHQNNGYVVYNENNNSTCTVSSSFSDPEYTLTFWVNYKCQNSQSDCNMTLSGGHTLQFNGNSMTLDGESFSLTPTQWYFIVIKRSAVRGAVYIGDSLNRTVTLPSTIQLEINPDLGSGDNIQFIDMRYFNVSLSDRELQQILTNSASISQTEPYSECRCPASHPSIVIVDTNTPFHLKCADHLNGVTSRFKSNSIPHYVIDNNLSTAWRSTETFLKLTLEFPKEYLIEKIEVTLGTTPCNATLMLRSGHKKNFFPPYGLVWDNITASIGTRSQYEQVLSNTVVIELNEKCGTSESYHQISEVIVHGWCHCYGNSDTCGASDGCNCKSNTMGTNCQSCTNNYFRQKDDFGCSQTCNCKTEGVSKTCEEVGGRCVCKANVEGIQCGTCKHLHYNLTGDNPAGCTRSPCNETGTLRCNNINTCDSCVCKQNVTNAHCDSCVPNHYWSPTDTVGCVPCGCNMSGSLNDSCIMSSGQCHCKQDVDGGRSVEGRQCDRCSDGYYGLKAIHTTGCQKCICNRYGSSSPNVCDKVTGQCPCFGNSKNKACSPVITSMEPTFGPQMGGTMVTVKGHHLGQGSNPSSSTFSIFFENQPTNFFSISTWSQEEVIFMTKPSTGTVTFMFKWTTADPNDIFANQSFQYRPDPIIKSVQPLTSYRRGGCDIRISGSDLNSVYRPQLKSYLSNNVIQITECTASSSTLLVCKSPNVTDTETSFTYGLVLDGVTMYGNLSNLGSMVTVVNDPVVTRRDYDDYKMLWSDTITIQGSGLTSACPQNLKITIGKVNCIIESATNESLVCKPDMEFPGVNMKGVSIIVTMGYYSQSAGLITFIEFWKTMEFIGIAIGVACGLFLVLLIVICCCCKKRRKSFSGTKKDSDDYVNPGSKRKSHNYLSLISKESKENGFDRPLTGAFDRPSSDGSGIKLETVEKVDVQRFPSRVYSGKPLLETALTYSDTDCSEDFLHKIESTVRDKIQRSISDRKNIAPGNTCTLKGTEIRVTDGAFSKDSPKAGDKLTIKTNVRLLKDLMEDNKYPPWLNNGLLECMKFQDCFHDNIIRILGISVDLNRFYILYPFSTRVFKEYLKDDKNDFTQKQLMEMCAQVANGMCFIDKENMVHKDLATRNCVVMPDGCIKISDASFSWNLYPDEYMFDKEKNRYLPVRWMALESLTMGFYDISSDVWSFGVLIWEVMTLVHYLPYHDQTSESIKSHISDGYRLGMPTNVSDDLYGLMVHCWEADNTHRPTFDEIINRLNSLMDPESIYVNQAFK